MSETKQSKKKPAAKKVTKAVKVAPSSTPQVSILAMLAELGISEQEAKGLVAVLLKAVAQLPKQQEMQMARDEAMTRAGHVVANNAGRAAHAAMKIGNLVDFVADILTRNQSAVRAAAAAGIWSLGLRAAQTAATVLGQSPEQAISEWVASAEATSSPADMTAGTKPVEQPQPKPHGKKHHGKRPHERQQRPLKATLAEQMAAKGLVPASPEQPPAAE